MSLAFGIAAHAPPRALKSAFQALLARLGDASGFAMEAYYADSYEELTARFAEGRVTLAWLPPLPFMALERADVAVPLVVHHRGGAARYESVLIVRADSPIRTLADVPGTRIAWVDPLSTSGYVVPRIRLAAAALDPRRTFSRERFAGSHDAAVRAVVGGAVELAATYARVDPESGGHAGAWTSIEGASAAVRVLVSFGQIPSDVTAARRAMHKKARAEIARALLELATDAQGAAILREVFGADAMAPWSDESYEPLRRAIADAGARGLLPAIETLDVSKL